MRVLYDRRTPHTPRFIGPRCNFYSVEEILEEGLATRGRKYCSYIISRLIIVAIAGREDNRLPVRQEDVSRYRRIGNFNEIFWRENKTSEKKKMQIYRLEDVHINTRRECLSCNR